MTSSVWASICDVVPSSKRTSMWPSLTTRFFESVRRRGWASRPTVSTPRRRRAFVRRSPSGSSPTTDTRLTRAPRPAAFAATFAAPPGASSERDTATTGTGASGHSLPELPDRYASSMASPMTSTLTPARLSARCGRARLTCSPDLPDLEARAPQDHRGRVVEVLCQHVGHPLGAQQPFRLAAVVEQDGPAARGSARFPILEDVADHPGCGEVDPQLLGCPPQQAGPGLPARAVDREPAGRALGGGGGVNRTGGGAHR